MYWVVTSCSSVEVHRRFAGVYRLHLQVRSVIQEAETRGKHSRGLVAVEPSNQTGLTAVDETIVLQRQVLRDLLVAGSV